MDKFTIFKNDKKEKEAQPDYHINVKREDGEYEKWGACWIKKTKDGLKTYLSCAKNKPMGEKSKDVDF
jgi:uncharacterized protein (DUF736 family)